MEPRSSRAEPHDLLHDTTPVHPCALLMCTGETSCAPNGTTSFVCVCPDQQPPANDDGNCDNQRGQPSQTLNQLSGVIGSAELISMNSNSIDNSNHQHDTDAGGGGAKVSSSSSSDSPLSPAAMTSLVLALSFVATVAVVLLVWRHRVLRHRGANAKGHQSGGSNNKHHQQHRHQHHSHNNVLPFSQPRYAANPNYYSSGADTILVNSLLKSLELRREQLRFSKEIGQGCFGHVFKGELSHQQDVASSVPVAVKMLKENASREAEADFQKEAEIMSSFSHANILQLIGVVVKDTGSTPWMVFEYMEYGDLADLLRKNSPHLIGSNSKTASSCLKLDRESLMSIAVQVASGMLYLSQNRFVHRDLATRNCLVGHNLEVKISDFGMSRDIYTCDYYKIGGSRLLPVRWMAPESIMFGRFTLESDVWSFGVLLWEVFTYGKQPYYGQSNEEVVKLIVQGILLIPPDDCPSFIYKVMKGCWRTDPSNRLTFKDVHPHLVKHLTPKPPVVTKHQSSVHIDTDNYLIPKSTLSPPILAV